MRLFLITSAFFVSAFTQAHEGGHGVPSDPIANLTKINITQKNGKTTVFGVDGIIKGKKIIISLLDETGAVTNPTKSGLQTKANGEILGKSNSKFDLKLNGNFYEGSMKEIISQPKVKLTFLSSNGKKQTKVLEGLEQVPGDSDEHTNSKKPHSHGKQAPHTH